MKVPGVDLKLHPIVTLTPVETNTSGKTPEPDKKEEHAEPDKKEEHAESDKKEEHAEPDKKEEHVELDKKEEHVPVPAVAVTDNTSKTMPIPTLTESVTAEAEKKVKVYLNEDLMMEHYLIQNGKQTSPVKGKELCKYFKYFSPIFLCCSD